MQISVITSTGHSFPLDVEWTDTVGILRDKIHEKEGIPQDQQLLSLNGMQLTDGIIPFITGDGCKVFLKTEQIQSQSLTAQVELPKPQNVGDSPYFVPNLQRIIVLTQNNSTSNSRLPDPMIWQPKPLWYVSDYRINTYQSLQSQGVDAILGLVKCHACQVEYMWAYTIDEKVVQSLRSLDPMDSSKWLPPKCLQCQFCFKRETVKPVIGEPINWAFLLVGDLLGHVINTEQLRFLINNGHDISSLTTPTKIVQMLQAQLYAQLAGEG